MPGDALLGRAGSFATRAISIAGPPEHVWPWLVQVGYRRALVLPGSRPVQTSVGLMVRVLASDEVMEGSPT